MSGVLKETKTNMTIDKKEAAKAEKPVVKKALLKNLSWIDEFSSD
jgi:hypothetical protein